MRKFLVIGVTCATIAFLALSLEYARRSRATALGTKELIGKRPDMEGPLRFGCMEETRAYELAFPSGSPEPDTVRDVAPMTEDQIALYRAVIRSWDPDERSTLRVSAKTYPLNPASLSQCGCLKNVELRGLVSASRSYRHLTTAILPAKHMILAPVRQAKARVSEASLEQAFGKGTFALSEIAFDKEHRHAIVGYSFWCGPLCGRGITAVYEKVNGMWKRTDQICGEWIS